MEGYKDLVEDFREEAAEVQVGVAALLEETDLVLHGFDFFLQGNALGIEPGDVVHATREEMAGRGADPSADPILQRSR
jgi:hypothetical protein